MQQWAEHGLREMVAGLPRASPAPAQPSDRLVAERWRRESQAECTPDKGRVEGTWASCELPVIFSPALQSLGVVLGECTWLGPAQLPEVHGGHLLTCQFRSRNWSHG